MTPELETPAEDGRSAGHGLCPHPRLHLPRADPRVRTHRAALVPDGAGMVRRLGPGRSAGLHHERRRRIGTSAGCQGVSDSRTGADGSRERYHRSPAAASSAPPRPRIPMAPPAVPAHDPVSADIDTVLKQRFGFPAFRAGQRTSVRTSQAERMHSSSCRPEPASRCATSFRRWPEVARHWSSPALALMKDQWMPHRPRESTRPQSTPGHRRGKTTPHAGASRGRLRTRVCRPRAVLRPLPSGPQGRGHTAARDRRGPLPEPVGP